VVIGIISILAALLLPALSRAKVAALNTSCKGNMRQLGISLTSYTQENGGYPYALDYNRFLFWYDLLAPHYGSNMNLAVCPAFKGHTDIKKAVYWFGPGSFAYPQPASGYAGVSYGYNGYGIKSSGTSYSDSFEILGLGPSGGGSPAIRTSRVKYPAEMIAMADSMQVPVAFAIAYSYLLAVGDGARPSPERHNGGANVTFCDGHVENILNKRLLEDSDLARRRWNNDHEPHFEVAIPK
jgi:prepilin-type processing-associated H-X9-DG protein